MTRRERRCRRLKALGVNCLHLAMGVGGTYLWGLPFLYGAMGVLLIGVVGEVVEQYALHKVREREKEEERKRVEKNADPSSAPVTGGYSIPVKQRDSNGYPSTVWVLGAVEDWSQLLARVEDNKLIAFHSADDAYTFLKNNRLVEFYDVLTYQVWPDTDTYVSCSPRTIIQPHEGNRIYP